MSEIKTQLREEIAEVEWRDLQPHAKRDAIILVNPCLDLVDVGVAIAEDQTSLVQAWITENLIQKPSLEQLTNWNQHPDQKLTALIVQPFVLVSY